MARNDGGKPVNPLKAQGESKRTTRAMADHAAPRETRRRTYEAGEPGRFGSGPARWSHDADTGHPSQHGGVRIGEPEADPRRRGEDARPGVKRNGPSPADLPRSERTGTKPHANWSGGRTGKTKGIRRGKSR